MSRTPIAAANWKMHKTSAEAAELARRVCAGAPPRDGYEIVLCPPYTALAAVVHAVRGQAGICVGAQNCYWEREGAFTGEVAAPMIAEVGCTHVIIGHSERRQFFGETEVTVSRRLRAALDAGLTAIVCIGETAAQRQGDETKAVLRRQLKGGLAECSAADWPRVILAYEPVWAIGTGNTATPEMANDGHAFVREWLAYNIDEATAQSMRILYGGSVKPENACELFAQEHIDGGLIGGASLHADKFLAITQALVGAPAP